MYGRALSLSHPIDRQSTFAKGMQGFWMPLPGRNGQYRLHDLFGRSRHAAFTGSPTWRVGTNQSYAIGCTGGAAFQVPNYGNIVAGDFTIACLHKPTTWDAGGFACLFDKGTGSNREIAVFVDTSGNISYCAVGNTTGTIGTFGTGMTTGSWWLFMMTRIGSTVECYVNGISKGTNTGSGTTSQSNTLDFGDNPSGGGTNYDGYYGFAAVWDYGFNAASAKSFHYEYLKSFPTLFNRQPRGSFKGAAAGGTTVIPSTLALTTSAFAPTVRTPRVVVPSLLALTTSKFAPTVKTPRVCIPSLATLTTTKFAPTVLTPRVCVPSTKALTITAFAPTIVNPKSSTPSTASLVLSTFAPTVTVSNSSTFIPSTASLVLSALAPSVLAPRVCIPTTKSLSTTTFAAIIKTPRLVVPDTLALSITEYTPSIRTGGSSVGQLVNGGLVNGGLVA